MSTDSTPAPVAMTIHAELDGWPVDLEISATPAKLPAYLLRLAELGYSPRPSAPPAAPVARVANLGGPCCPSHGPSKVKESDRRPGTFYCSAKLPDGSYCKERPQ